MIYSKLLACFGFIDNFLSAGQKLCPVGVPRLLISIDVVYFSC